jgi:hypothetical protein
MRRTTMTKLDMARTIVQALYRLPQQADEDNWLVKRKKRLPKTTLAYEYNLAIKALDARSTDDNQ